jgi:hypothetical protein
MAAKDVNVALIGPYTLVEYDRPGYGHGFYAKPGGGYITDSELRRIAAREGWAIKFGIIEFTYA